MADSTKNYTIKIDTQVTGAQSVQNLGEEADNTGDKFTRLQKQIKDTRIALQQAAETGDTVKFQKLKAQLDELEDGLEAVNYKSMQLDDQLQQMPGAAGRVGSAMKGLDSVFKLLKANPLLAVIGTIAGIFMGIYAALKKNEEGTKALNKVSEAFGNLITPIISFISTLAIPIIENFAKSLNWVGKQLGFVNDQSVKSINTDKLKSMSLKELKKEYDDNLKLLRLYDSKIKEVTASQMSDIEGKYEWIKLLKLQKNEIAKYFNEVSQLILDKTENEAIALAEELSISGTRMSERDKELAFLKLNYTKQQTLLKDGIRDQALQKDALTKLEVKYNLDRKNINDKYNKENEDKRKQNFEKELNDLAFEKKIQQELDRLFLNERQKELLQANIEFKEMLNAVNYESEEIAVTLKNIYEINRIKKLRIKEKYDEMDIKAQEELNAKILESTKERIEKERDLNRNANEDWFNEFTAMSNNVNLDAETRMQAVTESTNREIEIFKQANNVNADNYVRFQNQINAITDAGAKKRAEIAQQERQQVAEQYAAYSDIAQGFGSLLQDLSDLGDESLESNKGLAIAGIIVEKAGSIAQIIANTAIANSKARAQFPLTSGQPWIGVNTISAGISIASTIAASAKAIQQIGSTNKNSTSDSGGGATLPSYPTAPSINIPQVQVTQQSTVGQEISQTLSSTKANKAYVLSSDVNSAQAVERRIKANATF